MKDHKILRKTFSICPICLKKVKAKIVEEDGQILMKKECATHGKFNDTYWSDPELYYQAEEYDKNAIQSHFRSELSNDKCPYICGLCDLHESKTVMAVIDVTSKCNMECPTCFASSPNLQSYYEPTKESILNTLKFLKERNPPPPAVMFSGGEPTIRDDIIEIVKMAHDLKFMILLATNGLRLADKPEMLSSLKDVGLNIIYLQFDGVTDAPYKQLRGLELVQKKLKLIKLCRNYDIEIILVPTIQSGVNDNAVGDIIKFAVDNVDIIRGIVFQPMAFTGRIKNPPSKKQRICNSTLAKLIREQTEEQIKESDLFPVSVMVQPIKVMETFLPKSWPLFTATPYCGLWNWILVSKQNPKRFMPINSFLDFDAFFSYMSRISTEKNRSDIGKIGIYLKLFLAAVRSLNWKKVQQEAGLLNAIKTLIRIHTKPSYDSLGDIRRRLLLIGSMAFMDPYNFDVERVKRCVIHYTTPDLKLIPFCAYNIFYRQKIEKKYCIIEEKQVRVKVDKPIHALS